MPKIAREVTAMEVAKLRGEGAHSVGGVQGLYLQILGGSKVWVYRFKLAGRRRRMGLGSYPTVTLAQARERARAARAMQAEGVDPIAARQAVQERSAADRRRALSFRKAREAFIDAREHEWRSSKHRKQWESTLATYAEPILGDLAVADITQEHVLKVLEPIWRTKTETATRVRGRIEQILDWATVKGHRSGENPARWRGHLDKLLPAPAKIAGVEHHPAVEVERVPDVVRDIAGREGMAARALLFQLLTTARSGEVRGATWQEMDLEGAVWSRPAERMKAKKPHRVALPIQAVELLKALPRFEGLDLVFPSTRETMLSDMALTAVMRRMGLEAVPHGFRSSFRDWAADYTNHPRDLVEMALAHAIESKVEAAYRRRDMLARRFELMQAWADYCFPRQIIGPAG